MRSMDLRCPLAQRDPLEESEPAFALSYQEEDTNITFHRMHPNTTQMPPIPLSLQLLPLGPRREKV